MSASRPILAQDFVRYTVQPVHWPRAVLAAAGGYGAALAFWQLAHRPVLEAFIFKNQLPLDARRVMAIELLVGAAGGLLLWFALGLLLPERLARGQRWERAAGIVGLGAVLPILSVLALPGIGTRAPFFTLICVAVTVALVVLILRSLSSRPAAAEAPTVRSRTAVPAVEMLDEPTTKLDRTGLFLMLGMVGCYALLMSALAITRHNAYQTNAFDLGIHDQAVYNILHSGYMRTTLYGTYAIDYIGDHFSPILYLLAPIYALHPDARTLLVLQTLFLAAAAIPLYLLARLKTRSVWLPLALVAAYLLHPALHGVNLDDFHQLALVAVFVLGALYFLETERSVPFLLCLALALLVKEEVALTVVAVGAYVFLAKGRRRLGAALVVTGGLYFLVVTGWVMPHLGGTPQIDTRFGEYIAPETRGATGVAWTLLTNPIFTAVSIFGNQGKLIFLLQVFLPVLFLPLLASPVAWLVAIPALAVQTLTNAYTQYNVAFHYTAHLLPLVFFLAILGLARLRNSPQTESPGTASRRGPRVTAEWAIAAGLVLSSLTMGYLYSRALPQGGAPWPRPDAHDRVVDQFVARIPAGASVSTLGGIVPHLTTRKTVYLFPDVADAEFLLLDTSLNANYWPYEGLKARDQSLASMAKELQSGQFGLLDAADGVYLFQRGRDVRDNEAALRKILSTRYEAEAMRTDLDAPVTADPAASGGKARVLTPELRRSDGKSAAMYGPYTDLQPGNYRATFVLKGSGVPPDARVLTLDVFTHKDGYPRAVREVFGRDLGPGDSYQSFALDFNTSGVTLEDVEFRATYDFVGEVLLDQVDVEKMP